MPVPVMLENPETFPAPVPVTLTKPLRLPVPSPLRFVTFEIAPFVMFSAPLTVRLVPTLITPVELTVAP